MSAESSRALPALPIIESLTNPLIKRMRRLRDKRHRRAEKLFIAEGARIACEAQAAGVLPLWLFTTEIGAARATVTRLIAATQAHGGAVIRTTSTVLNKLSGKENSQTIVGIYRQGDLCLANIVAANIGEAMAGNLAPIWLVAERLRDPGNLGTLLRTGDAVGAGGLILLGDSADPYAPEAVRASMGAIFTQKLAHASSEEFLSWLRDGNSNDGGDSEAYLGRGHLVAAHIPSRTPSHISAVLQSNRRSDADCHHHSIVQAQNHRAVHDYQAVRYPSPTFILVGNESQGLPEALLAAADRVVSIPMRGKADSLNVAVAASVLAYEVYNQQRRFLQG